MTAFCVRRHHDMLCRAALVGLIGDLLSLLEGDGTLRVRKPCRRPYHNRCIVSLAVLKGELCEVLCLLRVGRLEHGHLRHTRHTAGVLFILGGVETWIVGGCKDKSSVCPDVGYGVERVARHVDTDHFHGCHGAHAADGCADGDFHGNLLVGCPLCVDLRVFYDILTDLGAGSSGVSARHFDAGLIGTAGNRLIAQHDFCFAHLLLPFCCRFANS